MVAITDYIKLMSRTVIAAVDDMLFISKIRATAEHVGVEVRFARNTEALLASARENQPNLIIVDLHSQKIDPLALARALKSDPELQAVVLLGFFSHVQTDLMSEATKAGYDRVMPRSAFSKDLASILAG
jgi:PleD family two-component response regulator